MKFTLTITDASEAEIRAFLNAAPSGAAAVQASPAPAAMSAPQQPTQPATSGNDDDDENAPADPNAPAIDKDGFPWDERIHSGNKKMNADGTWRKKRGVSAEQVKQVEAELKSTAAPVAMPTQQPTEQTPAAPVAMPTPQQPMQPATAPAATPAAMPMPANPEPAAAAPQQPVAEMDFMQFMQSLANLMNKQDANGMPLVDYNYLNKIKDEIGGAYNQPLNAITDLQNYPHMIGYAVQLLQRDGKW